MNIQNFVRGHRMLLALLCITLLLALFSIQYLTPQPFGDSPSCVESIGVMTGLPASEGFVPNRILTAFGGLLLVLLLAPLFGILPAWMGINVLFYLVMAIASFFLIREIFKSDRIAFLGALFIAGNYAPLVFGLHYLMDMGGWAFYLLALWGVARFVNTNSASAILWASAAVGVGALFKEYALLGAIAIAVALIAYAFREPLRAVKLMAATAALALTPVALVHIGVYNAYGYTYLDWARYNAEMYVYTSRTVELVKAIGSLVQLLAPLAAWGAWLFVRRLAKAGRGELLSPLNVTIAAVVLSALPALFWGGVTQRVLFVLVPAAALLASFVFERYERRWYAFLLIAAIYIVIAFSTDVLLPAIQLPF